MSSNREPLFEPIARLVRFFIGSLYITHGEPITLVDIGCGPKIRFYHFARRVGIVIKKYIGVDPLIAPEIASQIKKSQNIILKTSALKHRIDLLSNSVDCVVAFAYLEHIDNPDEMLKEMIRVVKPGGSVVITTPTPFAKPILEFLSYILHLISRREIEEHKQYFTRGSFKGLILKGETLKAVTVKHRYFELFLNNLVVITKK